MNINIIKRLDLRMLDRSIDIFCAENDILNANRVYVIMNRDTANAIMSEYGVVYNLIKDSTGVSTYQGCRIAYDEGLEFGEIEIR